MWLRFVHSYFSTSPFIQSISSKTITILLQLFLTKDKLAPDGVAVRLLLALLSEISHLDVNVERLLIIFFLVSFLLSK